MKRRSFMKSMGAAASVTGSGCSFAIRKNKYADYQPSGDIPRRTFGKTGIEVSQLGFGSHLKKELIQSPEKRDRMIKLGFDGGVNTFDVYDHGGYNQFEPMGKSIRDIGRKDAVVSLCAVKKTEELEAEIESSCKTFYSDYIDLYRLYQVDDERMAIMEKAKEAGKLRAIGVVSHDVPTMEGYVDRYRDAIDFVMIVYNFHHNKGAPQRKNYPNNDYTALIPRCESMNYGILGIKPMGSDAMVELALKERFFKDKEANIAQAMLRHVYETPEIDCTMPAMNGMDEVLTNLESAFSPKMSGYERTRLSELSTIAARMKQAYLPDHYKWLENWHTRLS